MRMLIMATVIIVAVLFIMARGYSLVNSRPAVLHSGDVFAASSG